MSTTGAVVISIGLVAITWFLAQQQKTAFDARIAAAKAAYEAGPSVGDLITAGAQAYTAYQTGGATAAKK